MRKRRKSAAAFFLAVILGLFSSSSVCPHMGKSGKHGLSSAAGEDRVVIGLLSDPKTLNPLIATSAQSKDIIDRLFLKLLDENADFVSFHPRLADNWEFSDDSLAITFHLRNDVVWSDGEPCTAGDVKFTWKCQMDTVISWPGRHLKDRIEKVEAVDDFTVVFYFKNRYPYQLMDANDGVILPEHLLAGVARDRIRTCGFGRNPVGNGPFVLSQWISDQYLELKRNPLYYENEKPRLHSILFRIVPDMQTLNTQIETGEIDCLESISPDEAARVGNNNKLRLYSYPSRRMSFIAWNLEHELFADREVRRALAMAVNRKAVIDNVWRGFADPCISPMHPLLWAFDESLDIIEYNPESAAEILNERGWIDNNDDGILDKNGRPMSFELIVNNGNRKRIDIATIVQAYLKEIGVDVDIRVLEWNTFIDKIINAKFEACVMGWKVGSRADLTEFWHSSAFGRKGMNISRYNNGTADSLMEAARNTMDAERAKTLWSKCQRIIYDDQPFMFLAVPREVNVLSSRFGNVHPNPISFLYNIRNWTSDR